MADQVRVFVSHHHSPEEDAFTARLVADLEAAGADVWVDVVGVGAADFQKRINEALARCNWFVLVLTPGAIASPWVEMEVHAAIRLKAQGRMRGIIQVMAETVPQDQIPPTWGIYAHLDAAHDYAAALKLTLRELGMSQPSPAPSAPPVQPAHTAPSDRFPLWLASLGYRVAFLTGAEVILPPLCTVAAGLFVMGSDPTKDTLALENEQPQHTLSLRAFQISKYPVTVAEYGFFLRATSHTEPRGENSSLTWPQQEVERLDHPVVLVSWHDAVSYARWLSALTYQHWRLPREVMTLTLAASTAKTPRKSAPFVWGAYQPVLARTACLI
jgi:Sulfatase-modifying factor enzyme 1/TIR domain